MYMFKLAIKFKQNTTIKFIKLCICSYLTGLILLALAGQVTFVQSKRLIICVTSLFVCSFVFCLINCPYSLKKVVNLSCAG